MDRQVGPAYECNAVCLSMLVILACDELVGGDMKNCEECPPKDTNGVGKCYRCKSGYALSNDGRKCLGMYFSSQMSCCGHNNSANNVGDLKQYFKKMSFWW